MLSALSFQQETQFLFEVSWEAANKVGGIYTVIKTKSRSTVNDLGENYCLIGPHMEKTAKEVEFCEPPRTIRSAVEKVSQAGFTLRFAKWLVEGSPNILLVDIGSGKFMEHDILRIMWEEFGISIQSSESELCKYVMFGYIVVELNPELVFIAHFHEWLSSAALLFIRQTSLKIATVFTTHATILGRYLCAGDCDFYNSLKYIDVDYEAGSRGIYPHYCIERAAAHSANVFTCVSHITAFEAECLLKKKPDGVLPNGLKISKPVALHEFQNLHEVNKKKIQDFVRGHFSGYRYDLFLIPQYPSRHFDFDIDNTLFFFISGRNEYRNKGVDFYLESLSRLNSYLRECNSPITVVGFIIIPGRVNNYNVDTLRGQAVVRQLKEALSEISRNIECRLLDNALKGQIFEGNILLADEVIKIKRNILNIQTACLPPIVTHNMLDGDSDPILKDLRRLNLINKKDDRVKIIYHPEFLTSNSPVLGLDYEDFVRGCHLGVFPSYYEPWGYTPAECTILGIPSVTTNISGFGCFIEENVEFPADYGVYIVDRRQISIEESIVQLTNILVGFCQKSRRQRINQRNRVERLSLLLDWNNLGIEYSKARKLAISRAYGTNMSNEAVLCNGIIASKEEGKFPSGLL